MACVNLVVRRASALWLAAGLHGVARADDDAASTIKIPVPPHSYVRLEPSYTMLSGGGSASALLARGLFVFDGPDGVASALRLDLSLERVHSTTGLGDAELTELSGAVFGWGSIGAGLALIVPTATSAELGGGDLRIGPAFYVYVGAIQRAQASLVVRSPFAMGRGSTRSPAIESQIEPIISVSVTDELCIVSSGQITVDWLAGTVNVPVNLRVGRSYGRHWYVELGPEVVISGPSRGDLTLDLEVDYLE